MYFRPFVMVIWHSCFFFMELICSVSSLPPTIVRHRPMGIGLLNEHRRSHLRRTARDVHSKDSTEKYYSDILGRQEPNLPEKQISDRLKYAEGIQEVLAKPMHVGTSLKFRPTAYDLFQAGIVGIFTGFSVALFKLSINAVKSLCYRQILFQTNPVLMVTVPAMGGAAVGVLMLLGDFPPGLRGTVIEVDKESQGTVQKLRDRVQTQFRFLRKSAAATVTLGTGCSLGPEGPCVEIGMDVARSCMDISRRTAERQRLWNRMLLSCGAAAGVSAGFNAPIAGTFFALEIMHRMFSSIDGEENADKDASAGLSSLNTATIAPVLIASVMSALCARTLLGDHLVLALGGSYSLKKPLIELPLYMVLGLVSGTVSFAFSRAANLSQAVFVGDYGSDRFRMGVRSLSPAFKPVIGGILCGLVGIKFPQILFFGYDCLNPLLANNSLPTPLLLSLLAAKISITAISAGSGLVGGTFAPSLFLGAVTGAAFHNIVSSILYCGLGLSAASGPLLADVPAYAMVGAGSVLAALFRAPLTACLLLFEVTRDYDVILPLMASAGFGSVFADVLDGKFSRAQKRRRLRRDKDAVSWGDLSS